MFKAAKHCLLCVTTRHLAGGSGGSVVHHILAKVVTMASAHWPESITGRTEEERHGSMSHRSSQLVLPCLAPKHSTTQDNTFFSPVGHPSFMFLTSLPFTELSSANSPLPPQVKTQSSSSLLSSLFQLHITHWMHELISHLGHAEWMLAYHWQTCTSTT